MSSAVSRNQGDGKPAVKLALYVTAGTTAGALAGALVGAIGALIPEAARVAAAAALAVLAGLLAAIELRGYRIRPPQRDRETPQRWLHHGPVRWAARNGASLGVGVGTRLGFMLWYVVPAAALLGGHPTLGAAVWAIYGFARTGLVYPLLLVTSRAGDFETLADALSAKARSARLVCATAQLVLAGMTAWVVGL